MKKNKLILALAIGTVITGATILSMEKAKKEKKENKNNNNDEDTQLNEESFEEQCEDITAVSETASYPYLSDEDMIYLNEVSEDEFAKVEGFEDIEEKAIQHTVKFDSVHDLENYKNIVINEGFVVTHGEQENELIVLNISLMESDIILSKIFYLANVAKEYNGSYRKWIVK